MAQIDEATAAFQAVLHALPEDADTLYDEVSDIWLQHDSTWKIFVGKQLLEKRLKDKSPTEKATWIKARHAAAAAPAAGSAAASAAAPAPSVTAFGPPDAPAKLDTLIQKVCRPGSGVVWPELWGDQSGSMMFVEMYRPAVEELLEIANSSTQNCTPFALVNVSGSGKTSALFQLARHSWVCYVTCGTVRGSDYDVHGLESDAEFQDLVKWTTGLWQKFLQKHDNAQLAKRRPWKLSDYESFVQAVKHRMRIQLLARLLFLLYAHKHFKVDRFTAMVTAALPAGQHCIHLLVVRLGQLQIQAGQLQQCVALVVDALRDVESVPLFFAVDEAGLGFTSDYLCKCFRGGTSRTSLRSIASPLLQVMNEQQKPFVNIVVAGTERTVNTAEYLGSCLNKTKQGDIREIWDFPPISDPAAVLSQHTSPDLVKECDSKLISSLVGRPRHVARALDIFKRGRRKDKNALEEALEASAKNFCEDLKLAVLVQLGVCGRPEEVPKEDVVERKLRGCRSNLEAQRLVSDLLYFVFRASMGMASPISALSHVLVTGNGTVIMPPREAATFVNIGVISQTGSTHEGVASYSMLEPLVLKAVDALLTQFKTCGLLPQAETSLLAVLNACGGVLKQCLSLQGVKFAGKGNVCEPILVSVLRNAVRGKYVPDLGDHLGLGPQWSAELLQPWSGVTLKIGMLRSVPADMEVEELQNTASNDTLLSPSHQMRPDGVGFSGTVLVAIGCAVYTGSLSQKAKEQAITTDPNFFYLTKKGDPPTNPSLKDRRSTLPAALRSATHVFRVHFLLGPPVRGLPRFEIGTLTYDGRTLPMIVLNVDFKLLTQMWGNLDIKLLDAIGRACGRAVDLDTVPEVDAEAEEKKEYLERKQGDPAPSSTPPVPAPNKRSKTEIPAPSKRSKTRLSKCNGTTALGRKCGRTVGGGSSYCFQHRSPDFGDSYV